MTKYLRSLELSDDGALIEFGMSKRNNQAVFEGVVDLKSDIQRGVELVRILVIPMAQPPRYVVSTCSLADTGQAPDRRLPV
jgi:hypothetical protein